MGGAVSWTWHSDWRNNERRVLCYGAQWIFHYDKWSWNDLLSGELAGLCRVTFLFISKGVERSNKE